MIEETTNILATASAKVEMNIRNFKGDEVTNSDIKKILDLLADYSKTGALDSDKAMEILGKNKKTKKEKAVEK